MSTVKDVVTIQPMSLPVGQVFYMDCFSSSGANLLKSISIKTMNHYIFKKEINCYIFETTEEKFVKISIEIGNQRFHRFSSAKASNDDLYLPIIEKEMCFLLKINNKLEIFQDYVALAEDL